MRVQFEIDDDLWIRMKRYSPNAKIRHEIARTALEEWVARHEGRDKKLQQERLMSNMDLLAPIIQELVSTGRVIIS